MKILIDESNADDAKRLWSVKGPAVWVAQGDDAKAVY